MPIDALALRAEVNTTDYDDPTLEKCVAASKSLLDAYVADCANDLALTNGGIPEDIFDMAWLAIAVDMFNRRKAPNGILNQQFDLGDGSPVSAPMRISNDPLRAARPLLAYWCTEASFG